MQAALAAPRVQLARAAAPLSRHSSKLAALLAPWPQRREQQAVQRDVAAQARNRLADLLADMREESTEAAEVTAPEGGCRPPPPLPPAAGSASVPLLNSAACAAVTKLEWQSPLAVLRYPDPRLRAQNGRIAAFDDSLRQLAAEMFEVMYQ